MIEIQKVFEDNFSTLLQILRIVENIVNYK